MNKNKQRRKHSCYGNINKAFQRQHPKNKRRSALAQGISYEEERKWYKNSSPVTHSMHQIFFSSTKYIMLINNSAFFGARKMLFLHVSICKNSTPQPVQDHSIIRCFLILPRSNELLLHLLSIILATIPAHQWAYCAYQ